VSQAVVELMRALDLAARKHRDHRRKESAARRLGLRRQREYFEWAAKVVAGCRGVNQNLEAQFDAAYESGLLALEKRR